MLQKEGWESLVTPEQQESKEQRKERLQLNKDFVATFSTEHGKRVLDYFKRFTVNSPSWFPGYTDGHAQWREGQNAIIREIEARLKQKEE